MPQRLQRKRSLGWLWPPNSVYVGRGSKWGNPWRIGELHTQPDGSMVILNRVQVINLFTQSVSFYGKPVSVDQIRRELGGKDLLCYCEEGQACHADFLLEVANGKLRTYPRLKINK